MMVYRRNSTVFYYVLDGDNMKIDMDEFDFAMAFISCDLFDNEAYIDTQSGAIYCFGEGVEEPLPDDIYENKKYLAIPTKQDLALGKPLVLRFTALEMPDQIDNVYAMFRKRGAYAKYKYLLNTLELTEKWYAFEKSATEEAIKDWIEAQSIA